jgi:uncharacterized protein YggE
MRSMLAATLVGATLTLAAFAVPTTAQERTISVNGRGEISIDPDMATVVIGVQTEAEDTAQALDDANAATASILAILDVEDIPLADIRSGAIRLQPRYNQSVLSSGQQIIGYRAINSIEVDVTDLDQLGNLLAGLVGEGANRLDRVNFGLQDPTAATDEARRRAIAEGARLAALYADAGGVSIGDLMSLSESGGGGYRALEAEPVMMEAMATSAPQYDVPVAPGKIIINASISMVFAITD